LKNIRAQQRERCIRLGAFVAAAAIMALGRGLSFAQRGSVREGKPEISSPSTFDFSFYNQLEQHTPGCTYSAFVMERPP
jgi:hypothetical protein